MHTCSWELGEKQVSEVVFISAIALHRRLNMLMSRRQTCGPNRSTPPHQCFMELLDETVWVNNVRGRGSLIRSNHREDAAASPLSERDSLGGMLSLPLSCPYRHVRGKGHIVEFLRPQTFTLICPDSVVCVII